MVTHIGCSIIIYNNEGKVLISKRSRFKKIFPLMWETVGGGLEGNETPEECIRREVMEEVNCSINNLQLFKVYIVNEDNRYVLIVYKGMLVGEIKNNFEIEEVVWITKSDLELFDFCGNEKEKLLDYFSCH